MKLRNFLGALVLALAFVTSASAQESEVSGGGGTAGAITAGVGSGTAHVVPKFASATSVVDSKLAFDATILGRVVLYDNTAVTGVTQFLIRNGAGQGSNQPFTLLANDGVTVNAQFDEDGNLAAGDGAFAGTITGTGALSGLTTPAIPYATGANTLGNSGLYRAAAARIGLGGVTDSEPGFRWAGTTIDFVTAGAGAFIRINALEYQIANTSILKNAADGLLEIVDSLGATGGLKTVEMQGASSTALTDNTITDVVTISSAVENNVTGGHIDYVVVASDGTNELVQTQRGSVPFVLVNENGVVTVTLGTAFGTATDSAGGAALTNVFASSVSGTDATIRVTSDYDQATLTGTVTHTIRTRIYIESGMATVTPIP